MSEPRRTVTARTRLTRDVASFLDGRAGSLGVTRSELLRRLSRHYLEAHETGLDCPHCKNPIEIDL